MRRLIVKDYTFGRKETDDVNTSVPFENNLAECRTVQQANVVISAYTNKNYEDMQNKVDKEDGKGLSTNDFTDEDKSKLDDLKNYIAGTGIEITEAGVINNTGGGTSYTAGTGIDITNDVISVDTTFANSKQDTLTPGSNITIENNVISATGGGTSYTAGTGIDITNDVISVDTTFANSKQDKLYNSGENQNIKTINETDLLGTGNIAVQPTLVSGTNIKTINNNSLLGSGNINISGTTFRTIYKDISDSGNTASGSGWKDTSLSSGNIFLNPGDYLIIANQFLTGGSGSDVVSARLLINGLEATVPARDSFPIKASKVTSGQIVTLLHVDTAQNYYFQIQCYTDQQVQKNNAWIDICVMNEYIV